MLSINITRPSKQKLQQMGFAIRLNINKHRCFHIFLILVSKKFSKIQSPFKSFQYFFFPFLQFLRTENSYQNAKQNLFPVSSKPITQYTSISETSVHIFPFGNFIFLDKYGNLAKQISEPISYPLYHGVY